MDGSKGQVAPLGPHRHTEAARPRRPDRMGFADDALAGGSTTLGPLDPTTATCKPSGRRRPERPPAGRRAPRVRHSLPRLRREQIGRSSPPVTPTRRPSPGPRAWQGTIASEFAAECVESGGQLHRLQWSGAGDVERTGHSLARPCREQGGAIWRSVPRHSLVVSITPDGRVVVGVFANQIKVWDTTTAAALLVGGGNLPFIGNISLSPDGKPPAPPRPAGQGRQGQHQHPRDRPGHRRHCDPQSFVGFSGGDRLVRRDSLPGVVCHARRKAIVIKWN